MKKFIYSNVDGYATVEASDLNLLDMATEIGQAANIVYSGLANHDSELAEAFKVAVIATVIDSESPIWNVVEHESDETLITYDTPSEDEVE